MICQRCRQPFEPTEQDHLPFFAHHCIDLEKGAYALTRNPDFNKHNNELLFVKTHRIKLQHKNISHV